MPQPFRSLADAAYGRLESSGRLQRREAAAIVDLPSRPASHEWTIHLHCHKVRRCYKRDLEPCASYDKGLSYRLPMKTETTLERLFSQSSDVSLPTNPRQIVAQCLALWFSEALSHSFSIHQPRPRSHSLSVPWCWCSSSRSMAQILHLWVCYQKRVEPGHSMISRSSKPDEQGGVENTSHSSWQRRNPSRSCIP